MEPFKWDLPMSKFDISSISMEICRFSNWSFCWLWTVRQPYCFFGQVEIYPTCQFLYCLRAGHSSFTEFGQDVRPWKTVWIVSLSVWQKIQEHTLDLAQVIFNDSISRNQELRSPFNKQTSKVPSFISFCNTFFWFVRQNKICMIKIKTRKVLHNWGNIF